MAAYEEVEKLPERILMLALVGPCDDAFAITADAANGARYWINHVEVPVDVYRDALQTADKDRFCPGCMGGDDGEEPPEGSTAKILSLVPPSTETIQ